MTKMIEQMGEAVSNGEVDSISNDKTWPPKAAPRTMQKQMGEDRGNIDALMSGGHYDCDRGEDTGEGVDRQPEEPSPYQGDKKPRVAGGTEGFKGVPDVFTKVEPYPSVDDMLFKRENVESGFWAKDVIPVREAPGNSKIVGDMGTGMPEDGKFSGPARIGPGDMVSDYEPSEPRESGAEDTFTADLVGDLVTGDPQDGFPREEHMPTEVSPEGIMTGQSKGAFTPGTGQGNGGRK